MSTPNFLTILDRLGLPASAFDEREWQLMCHLHVAMPGIVQSFDPIKQTATVQPAVLEVMTQYKNGVPVDNPVQIAPLQNVPVIFPGGGGHVLTFPVNAGDECLLIFGDMSIDGWWQNGGIGNTTIFGHRHHTADAFAIIGPRSQQNLVSNYNPNSTELRTSSGLVKIQIDDGQLTLITDSAALNIQSNTGNINIQTNSGNVGVSTQSGTLQLTAPSTTVNGDLTVTGKLIAQGATSSIAGKIFLSHTHTGVTTGGGVSGGVF